MTAERRPQGGRVSGGRRSRFARRSAAPELMDDLALGGEAMERTLDELPLVNRYLGGLSATLKGLAPMVAGEPARRWRILDLGTGAGDIPAGIVRWARRRGIAVEIVAVDANPHICASARRRLRSYPEIVVVQADIFGLPFPDRGFDVAHAAMVLHHFDQHEGARILRIMAAKASRGLIVNDLQRHPCAYYAIEALTRGFSRSPLVRHDAGISVLRGFRPPDLEELSRLSGIALAYRWCWAFRYLLTARSEATP